MPASDGADIIYELAVAESQVNTPVYCSGAALASNHNGTIHVVFFIEQPDVCGRAERVANLRVVMDVLGWKQAAQVIQRAIRDYEGK